MVRYNNGLDIYDNSKLTNKKNARLTAIYPADNKTAFRFSERLRLTARSQDAYRNDPYVKSLVNTFVDDVCTGYNFQLTMHPPTQLFASENERTEFIETVTMLWNSYVNSLDFSVCGQQDLHSLTRTALTEQFINGDVLLMHYYDESKRFPSRWRIIDSINLITPKDKVKNQNINSGIEYNKQGEPIRYYISKKHPYAQQNSTADTFIRYEHYNGFNISLDTKEIVAVDRKTQITENYSKLNIIHLFSNDRADQGRGIPYLTGSFEALEGMRQLKSAELSSNINSARLNYITYSDTEVLSKVCSNLAGAGVLNPDEYNSDQLLESGKPLTASLTDNLILNLPNNTRIEPLESTKNTQNFDTVHRRFQQTIASAIGISYQNANKDYERATYSSCKVGDRESEKRYAPLRQNIYKKVYAPIFKQFVVDLYTKGIFHFDNFFDLLEEYTTHKFSHREPEEIDGIKSAQKRVLELRNGLITYDRVAKSNGFNNAKEYLEYIAYERNLALSNEVIMTDSGLVSIKELDIIAKKEKNNNFNNLEEEGDE